MDNLVFNGKCDSVEAVLSILAKLRSSQSSEKDEVLMIQLLEYASTHLSYLSNNCPSTNSSILKEINEVLSDKVYLLGCKKTVVDTLYYHMIYPIMSKLSIYDKERYVNISRWFDHLQNDDSIRQSKSVIAFNRTLLYAR